MRQILLQNAAAILLQNASKAFYYTFFITKEDRFYKMQQFDYKIRQLLQNATVITVCVRTKSYVLTTIYKTTDILFLFTIEFISN